MAGMKSIAIYIVKVNKQLTIFKKMGIRNLHEYIQA